MDSSVASLCLVQHTNRTRRRSKSGLRSHPCSTVRFQPKPIGKVETRPRKRSGLRAHICAFDETQFAQSLAQTAWNDEQAERQLIGQQNPISKQRGTLARA